MIHSTGDTQIPGEHGVMSWPLYNGRFLDNYQNWSQYIGYTSQVRLAFNCVTINHKFWRKQV
ncbi:MAG: hypothetical protein GY943_06925 [Chloroflexi bacterium]|nr:hypothetical protein [Chloroflexota bacterium]